MRERDGDENEGVVGEGMPARLGSDGDGNAVGESTRLGSDGNGNAVGSTRLGSDAVVLDVERVAEQVVGRLGEQNDRLKSRSRWLADQLERAAGSLLLNIGEQRHNTRGNRRLRLETAAGSASEIRKGLRFALLYRHLDAKLCAELDRDLDRVLAMLWRMRQRAGG